MKGKKQPGIRIIAGEWRSRRLPVADVPGLRPTTDRIRETLFNWLEPYIRGAHCLDLFAGTGALGFEALSRGAAEVVMIEQNQKAVAALGQATKLLETDRAQVHRQSALSWLQTIRQQITRQKFSIVFLDPPFAENLHKECLEELIKSDCLQEDALIYLEHPSKEVIELPANLQAYKEGKASQVRYSLLKLG